MTRSCRVHPFVAMSCQSPAFRFLFSPTPRRLMPPDHPNPFLLGFEARTHASCLLQEGPVLVPGRTCSGTGHGCGCWGPHGRGEAGWRMGRPLTIGYEAAHALLGFRASQKQTCVQENHWDICTMTKGKTIRKEQPQESGRV